MCVALSSCIPRVLANIVQLNIYLAEHKDRFNTVLTNLVCSVMLDIYDRGHSLSVHNGYVFLDRHCACLVRECPHSRIRDDPCGFIRRLYTADLIKDRTGKAFVKVPRGYL